MQSFMTFDTQHEGLSPACNHVFLPWLLPLLDVRQFSYMVVMEVTSLLSIHILELEEVGFFYFTIFQACSHRSVSTTVELGSNFAR